MLKPDSNLLLRALYCLLLFSGTCTHVQAQVAKVTKQRVVMIAQSPDAFLPYSYDTLIFKYGAKRGSVFVPYDNNINGTFGFRWYVAPEAATVANLPAPIYSPNALSVQYDTSYRINTLMTLEDTISAKEMRYTVYNEDNGIVDNHEFAWQRLERQVSYNENGDPEKVVVLQHDPLISAVDTYQTRTIIYNSQRQAIADTIDYADPARSDDANQYLYDDKGRVASILRVGRYMGTWTNGQLQKFFYGTDDKFLGRTSFLWMDNQWDTSQASYARYDGQGRLERYVDSFNAPNSIVRYFFRMIYNPLGLVDTLYAGGANMANFTKTIFFYNRYNNPDSARRYVTKDNGMTYAPDYRVRYYYEEYEDTAMVQPDGDLVVYPNPARDKVAIRWNGQRPSGSVYVALYAANGQRVRQVQITDIRDDNEVDISGIASGMYYLRVLTASGGLLYTGGLSVHR